VFKWVAHRISVRIIIHYEYRDLPRRDAARQTLDHGISYAFMLAILKAL
jgi:hypothetical protein